MQLEKKGLDLSEHFYRRIGRPVLEELFPDYMDKIAVGLVGEGSECFGYDDKISTDHDYGASFCIWLPRDIYAKIGEEMNGIYDALPKEQGGTVSKIQRVESQGRRGVLEIESFYRKFLGRTGVPKTLQEWMVIPEHYLAVATNGRVFEDNLGEFSQIRDTLLAFYPEDIRLKKIAARAITMAHAGQCNYARMMRRGDTVAAHFALDEFMRAAMSMAYLLNKKYTPYYKWMWRGMEDLKKLGEVRELLGELSRTRLDGSVWITNRWDTYQYALNTNDRIVELIEKISALIIEELRNQGISSSTSDYLEEHAYAARHRISDEAIRSLPILAS
jgi:hypothetical protein